MPTHKGLIQHILSPRESSGNQRRWPSTPPPPNFSSYAPVSPSLCFYLPLLLSSLQHGIGHASKGSAEQCEGPDRNLTFFFFFKRWRSVISWVDNQVQELWEKTSLCPSLVSLSLEKPDSWCCRTQLNQVHEDVPWHGSHFCMAVRHFSIPQKADSPPLCLSLSVSRSLSLLSQVCRLFRH